MCCSVGQVIGYVGHLFPPFFCNPLIKSFHFWPLPASLQYQKSGQGRPSWASIHISILLSLHCWSQRKIYASGARHNFCDWRIPLFFSLFLRSSILGVFWGRRREKSDDAEKHSCHRQSSKGPKPRKPVWALCKCICEYGWWFVICQVACSCRFFNFISNSRYYVYIK